MLTIGSDDHGEHGRPAIGLPREGFPEHWRVVVSPGVTAPPNAPAAVACTSSRWRRRRGSHFEVHAPRSDPPVLVARPQQAVGPVDGDAKRRWRGHALAERRALLVAAARAGAPLGEHLLERPDPDPGLGPGPELAALRLGGERAEEGPRLRLAERVGPHLERGRAARVHGGAERDAEDALAAPRADELREGAAAAAVLGHGALERHGALAGAAAAGAAGAGGVGGAGVVLVRRERRVVARVRAAGGGVVVERVVEGVGDGEDVLVVEAVVPQRGAARGRDVPRQRLAVGDPAALRRRGPRHRRVVVRLHGDRARSPGDRPAGAGAGACVPRRARAAGFLAFGLGVERGARGIRQPEPVKMGWDRGRRARRVRRGSERSGSEGREEAREGGARSTRGRRAAEREEREPARVGRVLVFVSLLLRMVAWTGPAANGYDDYYDVTAVHESHL